jgi:mono/diheme cytochrome c family protein
MGVKLHHWLLLATSLSPSAGFAADADIGRDIAQQRCAPCHLISIGQRNEFAQAPPFDAIGRKAGFDADMLAFLLLEPHPKMNFVPTQAEAAAVAAYIETLAK